MERAHILVLMQKILERGGRKTPVTENTELREISFRSLDFSELALRVEQEVGRELNFDAGRLRQIRTVADVLDFFLDAASERPPGLDLGS